MGRRFAVVFVVICMMSNLAQAQLIQSGARTMCGTLNLQNPELAQRPIREILPLALEGKCLRIKLLLKSGIEVTGKLIAVGKDSAVIDSGTNLAKPMTTIVELVNLSGLTFD